MNAILDQYLEVIAKQYGDKLSASSPYRSQHFKWGFYAAIKVQIKFHEWLDTNEWACIDVQDLSYKNLFKYYLKNVFKPNKKEQYERGEI